MNETVKVIFGLIGGLALSTEEMREMVSEDETAVGYVAFSSGVLGAASDDTYVSVVSIDGIPATAETIRMDAIVLIVNGENPISDLSLKEIKNIYDGKIKDWIEL